MAPAQLGRAEQMLAFFVKHCAGRLGRTQLMKFLYLADYEARRFIGRPISDVRYIWHHHGPYDTQLPGRISALKAADVIREDQILYPTGKQGFIYYSCDREVDSTLEPIETAVLHYVCETYSRHSLQSLLDDVVYETEPMQHARVNEARHQPLDMSMVDNQKRFDLGIAYDELLKRSVKAREKNVVEHEEAMALIRKALQEDAA